MQMKNIISNYPKEVIIVGGGTSIEPYISLLQPLCANKFTILTNYSYKYFPGTFLSFMDRDFYKTRNKDEHPDIYEELKPLPLIVGINQNGIDEFKLDNTILLPRKKFYTGQFINLTGIFALSLAIELLNHSGTIYLLGFDWSCRNIDISSENYRTHSDEDLHFYKKEITHKGVGFFGGYEKHHPDIQFSPFIKEKDVKIFNVNPDSNINTFEKIDYNKMFSLLSNESVNQNDLRSQIKEKLCIQ
jgi:hypothetical protein